MSATTLKKGKADYDAGKMTFAARDYIVAVGVRLGYLDKRDLVYICELCQRAYEPEEINGVRKLKKFKGFTVDLRLQQFRNINRQPMQFIEFESPKGKKLLAQMHEEVTR